LRELESDHLERTKTALRIKKEEESSGNLNSTIVGGGKDPTVVEVSENLRTVEVEARFSRFSTHFLQLHLLMKTIQAIQYLSADFLPTSSQTSTGISQLVKDLDPFELTKAEKLQVVNLAPTEPVELYVVCSIPCGCIVYLKQLRSTDC